MGTPGHAGFCDGCETSKYPERSPDDPEIMAAEANVLMARIGSRVPADLDEEFHRRLTRRQSWFGF